MAALALVGLGAASCTPSLPSALFLDSPKDGTLELVDSTPPPY